MTQRKGFTVACAVAAGPALTAEQTLKLNKLKSLSQPTASLSLVPAGARIPLKPVNVKKEISCGVYLYPPNPNPGAISQRLFFVNTTGQSLPPGVHVNWEVEGVPASCCKGESVTNGSWAPNPPTVAYLASVPLLVPAQSWTRSCKAWVTMP
jgi:hypothetical protein